MSEITATTISELAGEVEASEVSIATTSRTADIHYMLEGINDYEINSDQDDNLFELCDSLVDVYTTDLHRWVGEADHGTYVSQAVEEGIADTSDFERMLMAGQFEWYRAIAADVIEWLETELEERFDDGVYVEAYYLDEDGNRTDEGVSADVMVDDVLISGEIEEHEVVGLFLVTGIDPDDAEYIFDTHTDDDGREFKVVISQGA